MDNLTDIASRLANSQGIELERALWAARDELDKSPEVMLIDPLERLVTHTEVEVRRTSANVLANIGSRLKEGKELLKVCEILQQMLTDVDDGVRQSAARAFALIAERGPEFHIFPQFRDSLLETLNDTSPTVRSSAIRAMGHIRELLAVDLIVRALRDPDDTVRIASAQALWRIGSLRAADALVLALDDDCERVRTHAAYGLQKLCVHAAAGPLINALSATDDSDDRGAIVCALQQIDDRASLETLIRIATSDSSSLLRMNASYGLKVMLLRRRGIAERSDIAQGIFHLDGVFLVHHDCDLTEPKLGLAKQLAAALNQFVDGVQALVKLDIDRFSQ